MHYVGNFRAEIDSYKRLLEKEDESKASKLENVSTLVAELAALKASNAQLLEEADGLRKTLHNLQEQMQSADQQTNEKSTAELNAKTEELAKMTESNTTLRNLIESRKVAEKTIQMQAEHLKQQNAAIKEKYTQQAAEHGQAFMVCIWSHKPLHVTDQW